MVAQGVDPRATTALALVEGAKLVEPSGIEPEEGSLGKRALRPVTGPISYSAPPCAGRLHSEWHFFRSILLFDRFILVADEIAKDVIN